MARYPLLPSFGGALGIWLAAIVVMSRFFALIEGDPVPGDREITSGDSCPGGAPPLFCPGKHPEYLPFFRS